MLKFYRKVFGIPATTAVNQEKYAYSLFGSKTIAPGTVFHNTFHHGVDINYYAGAPIKSAHAGILKRANGNTVAIYDSAKDVSYLYLHMNIDSSILNKTDISIPIGKLLGTQSNVGLGGSGNEHLHFEVRKGERFTPDWPSTDVKINLPTILPYDHLNYRSSYF